jgi:hypothetical protein
MVCLQEMELSEGRYDMVLGNQGRPRNVSIQARHGTGEIAQGPFLMRKSCDRISVLMGIHSHRLLPFFSLDFSIDVD